MNEDPILSRVTGADALSALYGCWPSFHDAAVERIILERAGPSVRHAWLRSRPPVGSGNGWAARPV